MSSFVYLYAEMGFAKKEYEFFSEIGLSERNLGCFVNGTWKARGPVVTTLNPANNQVGFLFCCTFIFVFVNLGLIPFFNIMG